jgi:uncharacterized protein
MGHMNSSPISPDWIALAGTALTIGVHLILTAAGKVPNAFFICGACLFWTIYVMVLSFRDPTVLKKWGFRTDNLPHAVMLPAVLFIIGAGVLATYAHIHGLLRFPWHTLALFLIYPIWGVIQQFLALAIVVSNLERLPWLGKRPALVVMIGAVLFGLIHACDLRLALGTFLLEVVLILLFLKERNIWPLGFLHGWIGGLFYLWVLNEDLWARVFGE